MTKNNREIRINMNKRTVNDGTAVLAQHGYRMNGFLKKVVSTVADWPRIKRVGERWAILMGVQLAEVAFVGMILCDVFPPTPRLRYVWVALVYLGLKTLWIMYNLTVTDPHHIKWYQWL